MNLLVTAALVILGGIFAALAFAGGIAAAWRSLGRRRGASAALAVFAVVATICAQKPSPSGPVITVDSLLRDAGCYATNDVFHVAVTNAPAYAGIDFSGCPVLVYARERGQTNAVDWAELTPRRTYGELPADYAIEDATNHDYLVYLDYIPPSPVHTNGVFELHGFLVPQLDTQLAAGFINSRAILPPPTARDYIQDGLIAMWDGIENAGWGTHNASATTWKDLIGNLDATTIDSPIFGDNYTDTSNGYWSLPSSVRGIVESQNLTAEVVFQPSSANTSNQGIVGIGNNRSLWLFFGNTPLSTSATLSWQVRSSSGIRAWYNSGVFGTDAHSSSVVNNNSVCNTYLDSTLRTITPNISAGSATSTSNFYIGRLGGYNKFFGKIYSVRIYSRALSADEIKRNYEIDKERFNLP